MIDYTRHPDWWSKVITEAFVRGCTEAEIIYEELCRLREKHDKAHAELARLQRAEAAVLHLAEATRRLLLRAEAAETEVERLQRLVREAYFEGHHTGPGALTIGLAVDRWKASLAREALENKDER